MHRLLILALCCLVPLVAADREPSKRELLERIQRAGETKPEWWDRAKLDYPQTLKLDWPEGGGGGWQPRVQPGAYFHSIVCPNRAKWEDGVKLLHYIIKLNEEQGNDGAIQRAGMYLIRLYGPMLQDWERSAYWLLKLSRDDDVRLANCFWQLGSKSMAESILKKHRRDESRHGEVIKLWADMGEFRQAYKLAADKARFHEDIGYYMAGYTAQLEGDYDKALQFFEQARDADQGKSGRDWRQTRKRAEEAIEAIRLFATFSLDDVADGTYVDRSQGYAGPVEVTVTVKDHKLTDVRVSKHKEGLYYSSLTVIPERILEQQSVRDIDGVMSATITSEAILYATAKAVQQGKGK